MRFEHALQSARGLSAGTADASLAEQAVRALKRAKWRLWHGRWPGCRRRLAALCRWTERRSVRGVGGIDKLRQHASDLLGYLERNEAALVHYAARRRRGEPIATSFVEKRPQLARALALCKLTGAVLIVAKLDRLARNAGFLLSVHDSVGEGGVVFCDLPNLPPGPVGTFMVQQLAAVAQLEAGLTSEHTKEALKASRARAEAAGTVRKRGGWQPRGYVPDPADGLKERQARADVFAAQLMPVIRPLRDRGDSLRAVAAELTTRGVRTRRDGAWTAAAVNAVLARG